MRRSILLALLLLAVGPGCLTGSMVLDWQRPRPTTHYFSHLRHLPTHWTNNPLLSVVCSPFLPLDLSAIFLLDLVFVPINVANSVEESQDRARRAEAREVHQAWVDAELPSLCAELERGDLVAAHARVHGLDNYTAESLDDALELYRAGRFQASRGPAMHSLRRNAELLSKADPLHQSYRAALEIYFGSHDGKHWWPPRFLPPEDVLKAEDH